MKVLRGKGRGFTLIELLIVVSLFSVLAVLALISIGRTRRQDDLDGFSREVSSMMTTARKRAVSTRTVYMVSLQALPTTPVSYSAQMCQVTLPTDGEITVQGLATLASNGAVPAVCPWPPLPGHEGPTPTPAGFGATVDSWAVTADQGDGNVVKKALPAAVYFLPDGSVDADVNAPDRQGFTAYMQGRAAANSPEDKLKRKIYVLPLSGRPRVIDAW